MRELANVVFLGLLVWLWLGGYPYVAAALFIAWGIALLLCMLWSVLVAVLRGADILFKSVVP